MQDCHDASGYGALCPSSGHLAASAQQMDHLAASGRQMTIWHSLMPSEAADTQALNFGIPLAGSTAGLPKDFTSNYL